MRTPQVTRTITTTKANVMCLDIEKGEPVNVELTLPRTYKDDKAILKAAEKVLEGENTKPVYVATTTVEETLYGMSEVEFIKHAEILPPRGCSVEQAGGKEESEATSETVTE